MSAPDVVGAVPLDEPLEGGFEVEVRGPVEVGVGAAGVELEVVGLVGAGGFVEDPGGVRRPRMRSCVSAIQETGWASDSAGPKL